MDAVNGAASHALPKLLDSFDCNVVSIHCSPNGKFPRGAEPFPNLNILGEEVIKHNADVGFATDPDGDRLAVVDEKGQPLGEVIIISPSVDGILSTHDITCPYYKFIYNIGFRYVAKKYRNYVKRSAVGEINVVNLMKDTNSVIGGEGNGGVILPESHYGRDALVGGSFLNRMAMEAQSVSEILNDASIFMKIKFI